MLMTIRANTLLVRQPYVDNEFLEDIRERQREGVRAAAKGKMATVFIDGTWHVQVEVLNATRRMARNRHR